MRFALWNHAGKGGYLRQRLLEAGHTAANTVDETDLLLVDCDWWWAHPRPELISAAHKAGARVALYPHGGWPTCFVYDGLSEPDPNVDLRLEHGKGSHDIAEMLGLELRQETPGWLFCPTHPFQPVDDPVRVLFAPMHPNMEALEKGTNGHDPAPSLNQHVYRQLLGLGFEVTVVAVGPLWRNGIWPHPRARLVENHQMLFHVSYTEVMRADVVVGAGTVGVTGVACGKPTVMFGQSNLADYINGQYQHPEHADEYRDFLRYPLDCEDDDLAELILRACVGDSGAAGWRADFAPDDGSEDAVRLLEKLVGVPSHRDAIIEGVTAKAGTKLF